MPFILGDRVEVTSPQEGFEHRQGDTGTVCRLARGFVYIEDEDGLSSAHYPHELVIRPA
ncbi:hypothetical protein ABZY44_23750 [Streptomyces sp. NPDC006544]|uniref:hypothetical protein n=1 Tax=Streptomyces sp. NPDC006544 TaxID=3154583 RepID=UPI0033ADD49F